MGLLHLNGGEEEWGRVFPDPGLGYRRKPCCVAKTTRKPKMPFGEGAAVTEGWQSCRPPSVRGEVRARSTGDRLLTSQKVPHRIAT